MRERRERRSCSLNCAHFQKCASVVAPVIVLPRDNAMRAMSDDDDDDRRRGRSLPAADRMWPARRASQCNCGSTRSEHECRARARARAASELIGLYTGGRTIIARVCARSRSDLLLFVGRLAIATSASR